jgi:hypothetical protein
MFQPLIDLLGRKLGVREFCLQVSGDEAMTTIIITPSLSAPAAAITATGYDERKEVYRALLTSPLIVRAPLADVDTRLAELIESYVQTLTPALSDSNVSSLLSQAMSQAKDTHGQNISKPKPNKKAQAATVSVSEAGSDPDSLDDEENGDDSDKNAKGSPAPQATGYDSDLLASLGL